MSRPAAIAAGLVLLTLAAACGGGGGDRVSAGCPAPRQVSAVHPSDDPGARPEGVRESFLLTLGLAAASKVGGYILGGLFDLIFGGSDDPEPTAVAADCPPPAYDFAAAGVPAGIGYQVYRVDGSGTPQWVDPDSMVFRTGDAAVVGFMTNLPGIVTAYNRNPAGVTAQIGQWQIAGVGGERLPRDGAFRFVDEPGEELLVLAFQPCRPDGRLASGYRQDALAQLPPCSAVNAMAGPESIVYEPGVTVQDGRTRVRLAKLEDGRGRYADPIMVPIRLVHE